MGTTTALGSLVQCSSLAGQHCRAWQTPANAPHRLPKQFAGEIPTPGCPPLPDEAGEPVTTRSHGEGHTGRGTGYPRLSARAGAPWVIPPGFLPTSAACSKAGRFSSSPRSHRPLRGSMQAAGCSLQRWCQRREMLGYVAPASLEDSLLPQPHCHQNTRCHTTQPAVTATTRHDTSLPGSTRGEFCAVFRSSRTKNHL